MMLMLTIQIYEYRIAIYEGIVAITIELVESSLTSGQWKRQYYRGRRDWQEHDWPLLSSLHPTIVIGIGIVIIRIRREYSILYMYGCMYEAVDGTLNWFI